MAPTLSPGDRLVVVRRRKVRSGDVVALPDPRRPERILVKRVATVHGNRVTVIGDNPGESTDSRHFGPVDQRSLTGLVVYRYHPRPRWFPGRGHRIG
jgi:nickel-type superoxide dismutase maturation protease